MNGSTGIAQGNKVLVLSKKIKGKKLMSRFHLRFKGKRGISKDPKGFNYIK